MINLKKKTAVGQAQHWRPNFRDYDALPDIRAVRTQFFLPAILIAAAVLVLSYVLFREYIALQLRSDIAALTAEIEENNANHDEKVEMNSEFMAIVRNIDEVSAFVDRQLIASDFLLAVSSRIQSGMHLTRIEYGADLAVIEGNLEVPAEQASRIVDDFVKVLQEGDVVQGLLTEYKLTSLERDAASNNIRFRIEISPAPQTKGKAKS